MHTDIPGDRSSTRRDATSDGDLTTRVVETVAAATGADSLATVDPLYDAVDPDALHRLVARSDGGASDLLRISFSFAGCEVTVYGDGSVDARPRAATDVTAEDARQ